MEVQDIAPFRMTYQGHDLLGRAIAVACNAVFLMIGTAMFAFGAHLGWWLFGLLVH